MINNLFTFVRTLGNQRIEGKKFFTTQIGVLGALSDGAGSIGTSGKVLSSTGTGVEWITVGGGTSNVDELNDLSDVVISTAASGQLLRFNGTSWVNWTPNFLTSYGAVSNHTDVSIASPATGQLLRYDGSNWVNWTHNFLTTSATLASLSNVANSADTANDGDILRYSSGSNAWIADEFPEFTESDTLDTVTDRGATTTNGITVFTLLTTGTGNSVTTSKLVTPNIEYNGFVTVNSVYQTDQGEPNPVLFKVNWNGDNYFTVNADGYAIATTGFKVTGQTGFLKANGTIDNNTYLTSYTETDTLASVTGRGNSTTNAITVGGITSGSVTTTLVEADGLLTIDADKNGGLQPEQGDPAVSVLDFTWQGQTQGYIDTDGKITFNGFKTPSGTSSGFLKADGSIDTNTYLTSVAPYALDDLTDVSVGNPQDGEFLKYDDITGEWISAAIPTPTLDSVTTAGNATANTIDVGGITTPYVQFEENLAPPEAHRSVNWSEDHNTLEVYYALEKHFDVGQDQMWYVKNGTEGILAKGTVVMAVGAVGNSGKIEVAPLVADGTVSGRYAVGILMDEVRAGDFAFAMTQGTIRGIDTSGFTEGDTLYSSADIPGTLVNVEPSSPALKLPIAFVVTSSENGAIAVRMTQGLDLHEVHDVQITDGANGQLLQLQSGIWTNWTPNYLTAETDPVFTASAAGTISTTNISNWNSAYGWGDHALAGYLTTYENNYISDIRISEFIVTFTGEGNAFNGDVDFSALPFAPVTHNHAIAEITGLQTALDGKQPVGNYITTETDPTVPAHVKAITEQNIIDWDKAYGWGNHADAGYATTGYVTTAIANLVDSAPSTLDTLNELAAALGDDPNFATTVTNSLATKAKYQGTRFQGDLNTLGVSAASSGIYSIGAGYTNGPGSTTLYGTMYTFWNEDISVQIWPTYNGDFYWRKSVGASFTGSTWRTIWDTSHFTSTNISNWNTAYGWGNNYISDVRLAETTLSFTGEGSAFTGDIDLSLLPFAASSHTHVIADVTGLQTALDGKVPTTRTLTINGTAFDLSADRSWTISSADGYISDVRLAETTLSFTGEGNAFTGNIDLSGLPFQPAGSYLTAEADTLATVTARGATTTSAITTSTHTISNGYLILSGASSSVNPEIELTDDSGFGVAGYKLRYENSNGWTFYDSYWASGGGHRFRTSVASSTIEALTISNNGNVGINTTNPLAKLDVVGHTYIRGGLLYVDTIAGYSAGAVSLAGSTNFIVPSGNVGIGTAAPDSAIEVNGRVSIRGGNELYFGQSTSSIGSWTTRMYASGSTHRFNAQTFVFNNEGYGGTTFAEITSSGVYSNNSFYFPQTQFNPSAGARTTTPAMSIKMWDNYFAGIGLGSDYGTVLQYYSRVGHVDTQVYFDAAGGSWYRTAAYAAGYGAWNQYITSGNIGSQSVLYATSSGNSVSTDQTNFAELFINDAPVATKEYVTSQGYLTSLPAHNHDDRYYTESESDARFIRKDADDSFSGNLSSAQSKWIKFYHPTQTDSNDGKIGAGVFDTGLNIVGVQTTAGTGRQVRVWGSLIDSAGNTYWHAGNDGSGSGLDADLLDGVQLDNIVWGNARGTNDSITSDADGLDKTGYYTSSGFTTRPSGVSNWMYIEHIKLYNNNPLYQKQIGYDTYDDRMWVRTRNGGSGWTGWKQIWTSGEFENNSTDWNTAYSWGNHADAPYWNIELTDDIGVAASSVRFNGSVRVDGDLEVLGTITETSSIRFKENITPLDQALDKVNQLEAVSYNKIGADDREIGLIAEEVAELFPEVVTYNEEGQPQGIQYQRLSVILLKAVQELSQEVNELKKKLN